VFQVTLPGLGPGALQPRSAGGAKDASALLNPAIDFYKRLALECSAQQVAVDLFILN
jgi:protein transport protein SEC24